MLEARTVMMAVDYNASWKTVPVEKRTRLRELLKLGEFRLLCDSVSDFADIYLVTAEAPYLRLLILVFLVVTRLDDEYLLEPRPFM